jgi:cation transport protein ChaC
LREREQVTSVYLERRREIRFPEGGATHALTYVVDRSHGQYAGKLDGDTQYRIVAAASGQSGANRDYVINTATHLEQLGMPDSNLDRLAYRLRSIQPV